MSAKPPSGFRELLGSLSHQHTTHRVFSGFVRLAACALATGTREAEYLEEAKCWQRSELEVFSKAVGALILEMETKPFEGVIGGCYMELALSQKGQQWNGEFHTPKPICDMTARLTVDPQSWPEEGTITVCEPARGAWAMILSLAQVCPPEAMRRLRVTAIDINRTACDMAFINTALWGIPTRVIHGNSLSLEFWAGWSNIHHIAPWLPVALRPQLPDASEQGQPPKAVEIQDITAALSQQELGFRFE